MAHLKRIVVGGLLLALLATVAPAQEEETLSEVQKELDQLRAEAARMTSLIKKLEAEGRGEQMEEARRKVAIVKEHLARFAELSKESKMARLKPRVVMSADGSLVLGAVPKAQAEAEEPPSAWLGVRMAYGDGNVKIVETIDRSPARAAGIRAGDVIVAVNGKPATSVSTLIEAIRAMEAGQPILLDLRRGDVEIHLAITLGERQTAATFEETKPAKSSGSGRYRFTGTKNGNYVLLVDPAVTKQLAAVAAAKKRLTAATAKAKLALAAGKFELAAKASIEAQRASDELTKALRELKELQAKNAVRLQSPLIPTQRQPFTWGRAATPVDQKIDALEKRLIGIEGRLARIEKLLQKLAR